MIMRTGGIITGVDEAQQRAAATAIRANSAAPHPELSTAAVGEIFARVCWNYLVEPGDGSAGALVAAIGAPAALELVITEQSHGDGLKRLHETGYDSDSFDIDDADLRDAFARWLPRLNRDAILRACTEAERAHTALLLPADRHWPAGLADLGRHAPLALWWRGSPDALLALDHSIALVGSRACSTYGEHVTMEASAGLVDRGFGIVSGAAYGIDGMAHRAALASRGTTIAILAGGLDRFYPSGHTELISRIAERGAIISEVGCGVSPTRWRFLQRNRIIAAVGQATVVLEAGRHSGSLNTANHAAAIGRPVGAVPGPVTSPTSAGCHRLLRESEAICVTNAAQMAELVQPWDTSGADAGEQPRLRDPSETRVLDALSTRSARSADDVARLSGLAVTVVASVLGTLELETLVHERERGWVRGAGA